MRSIIRFELKRAFQNKAFFCALFICLGLTVFHEINTTIPGVRTLYRWMEMYSKNTDKTGSLPGAISLWFPIGINVTSMVYFMIMPLLAVISYGDSTYLDYNNHFVNGLMIKSGKRQYLFAKLISLFCVGAVLAAIPMVVSLILNLCTIPVEKVYAASSQYLIFEQSIFGEMFYKNTWEYIVINIIWTSFWFGLLNTLCVPAAFLFENRFVVMLFPFALYMGSGIVIDTLASSVPTPREYFKMSGNFKVDSLWMIAIQLAVILLIHAYILIKKGAKREDVI